MFIFVQKDKEWNFLSFLPEDMFGCMLFIRWNYHVAKMNMCFPGKNYKYSGRTDQMSYNFWGFVMIQAGQDTGQDYSFIESFAKTVYFTYTHG